MSGQTVTFLTILVAIVFSAVTGLWLAALIGAFVIVGGHCAIWTALDARNSR